jgi:hypothetical protein
MAATNTTALEALAAQDAQQWNIPVNLFEAQIAQESSFNPSAVNGSAVGIAQFIPSTASQFGIDPNNPAQSLAAAAQYDNQLYQTTGTWLGALQGYGTLPASGPLTQSQSSLASLATSIDNTGFLTGGALSSLVQSSGVLGGLGGAISGFLGDLTGGASSAVVSLATWLEDVAVRAVLVFIGLVLIIGGIYLLGQRGAGAAIREAVQ